MTHRELLKKRRRGATRRQRKAANLNLARWRERHRPTPNRSLLADFIRANGLRDEDMVPGLVREIVFAIGHVIDGITSEKAK